MEPSPAIPQRLSPVQARRIGGLAFMGGAATQSVITVILLLSLLLLDWMGKSIRYPYFLDYLQHEGKLFNLTLGVTSSLVAYALLAWMAGRWAGVGILVRGRSYGGVGAIALLMPAFFATVVGLNVVSLYVQGNLFFGFEHFDRDVMRPGTVFFLILYLPGMLFGILAGLVTRQVGMRVLERSR